MSIQKQESLRRRFLGWALAIAGVAGLLILSGCATAPASLNPSYKVAADFRNFHPIPGYRYYYSGTWANPLAVIALKPGITLETKGWTPVAAEPRRIASLIESLRLVPWVEYNIMPNGAYIIDPNGKKVGLYYTVYRFSQIAFKTADTIDIAIPKPILPSTNQSWKDGPPMHPW